MNFEAVIFGVSRLAPGVGGGASGVAGMSNMLVRVCTSGDSPVDVLGRLTGVDRPLKKEGVGTRVGCVYPCCCCGWCC